MEERRNQHTTPPYISLGLPSHSPFTPPPPPPLYPPRPLLLPLANATSHARCQDTRRNRAQDRDQLVSCNSYNIICISILSSNAAVNSSYPPYLVCAHPEPMVDAMILLSTWLNSRYTCTTLLQTSRMAWGSFWGVRLCQYLPRRRHRGGFCRNRHRQGSAE